MIWIEPDLRFDPCCHRCGNKARGIHSHDHHRAVRDLNLGGTQTWLDVGSRKVLCAACDTVRVEHLSFCDTGRRIAGLDLTISKSGQGPYPRRKLSKRGSPHLRYALFMAAQMVRKQAPDITAYYERLREDGFHYTAATCCIARKLCYILWRLEGCDKAHSNKSPKVAKRLQPGKSIAGPTFSSRYGSDYL